MEANNSNLIELLLDQFTHTPTGALLRVATLLVIGIIINIWVWRKARIIPFIEFLQYFGVAIYTIATIFFIFLPTEPLQTEKSNSINLPIWPSEFVRSILENTSFFSLILIVITIIGGVGSIIWSLRNLKTIGKPLVILKIAITFLVFAHFTDWLFFISYLLNP